MLGAEHIPQEVSIIKLPSKISFACQSFSLVESVKESEYHLLCFLSIFPSTPYVCYCTMI